MQSVLQRVQLDCTIEELVEHAGRAYNLPGPFVHELILAGYQDLNVKFTCGSETYLLKVFSKNRSPENISDQVKVLISLREARLPVPALAGQLTRIESKAGTARLCVMEFFDGDSFEKLSPEPEDIRYLAGCLGSIHNLSLRVGRYYDDWGAANLLEEYRSKCAYLSPQDAPIVEEICRRFEPLPLDSLPKSIIHGDLYRAHALKNKSGAYRIIDFGCMDFNASVLDLAIFIAHFCVDGDQSPEQTRQVFQQAVEDYAKVRVLTQSELDALPVLIEASHAAYILSTSALIAGAVQQPDPPEKWLAISRAKLKAFRAAT